MEVTLLACLMSKRDYSYKGEPDEVVETEEHIELAKALRDSLERIDSEGPTESNIQAARVAWKALLATGVRQHDDVYFALFRSHDKYTKQITQ